MSNNRTLSGQRPVPAPGDLSRAWSEVVTIASDPAFQASVDARATEGERIHRGRFIRRTLGAVAFAAMTALFGVEATGATLTSGLDAATVSAYTDAMLALAGGSAIVAATTSVMASVERRRLAGVRMGKELVDRVLRRGRSTSPAPGQERGVARWNALDADHRAKATALDAMYNLSGGKSRGRIADAYGDDWDLPGEVAFRTAADDFFALVDQSLAGDGRGPRTFADALTHVEADLARPQPGRGVAAGTESGAARDQPRTIVVAPEQVPGPRAPTVGGLGHDGP